MPEEAVYPFDQEGAATEAAYPDPSDLGLTVKPDGQLLDIAEHAAPDDPKPFPRPDNDEQIQACEALARQLYEDIKIGKDAEKTGCNTFIDRAVALFHALSEPEREAYLHERNVGPPKAGLTSPYRPILKALYPVEGRSRTRANSPNGSRSRVV
jgi:hypothetical protein